MNSSSDANKFKQLDKLLEQAYSLEGEARHAFVKQLPEPQKAQIEKLLRLSNELNVSKIAEDAQSVVESHASQSSAAGNTPTTIGRWRLHRELGSGGMGQVFYATREAVANGDNVANDYTQEAAIKILWSRRENDEFRARFLRERRILASLNHPGLSRFIDGGFLDDGRPWFAMEYVEGTNIDEYAVSLPLEAQLKLFVEVCYSVAHAHQRLIVHRDIKPLNLLVDQSGHPRLLDFGVAGVMEDLDDGIQTQVSGTPLTLKYASPELVSGALVTVASDIYQLGLLLYKLLTGDVPHNLKDVPLTDALHMICVQIPSKPSTKNPAIPTDIDAIVMKALEKSPDARYRTVLALAEDVERYLNGHAVRAMPQTRWYRARRFLQRHAVMASIVGFSVLALTGATAVSLYMTKEARSQATRSATVQQILTGVFEKADPFEGKGANVTLAEALTRAQPEIEAQVANDPLLAWDVNNKLGQIYKSLGLVDQEISAYKAVLTAARKLGDTQGNYFLTGVAGLGDAFARTNPVDAVEHFDQLMPSRPNSADEVDAWLDGQYAYVGALNRVREFGRADAGAFAMAEVVEEFKVTDARKLSRLSQLLAGVARRADDLKAEDQHWRNTVEYMRQASSPSALAVTLNNWGIHLGRQKRYAESESAFLEAIAIYEGAGLQGPTFATVMRSYAGLLFRTERIDEAIATTERSLELLEPTSQFYARFIAELNLVQYTLVKGDTQKSLAVLTQAMPVAQQAFTDDPAIPQRMLRNFTRLLTFGRTYSSAATALGSQPDRCSNEGQILHVLESLEHPNDRPARDAIWNALNLLVQQHRTNGASQISIDEFITFYSDTAPLFFDVLDEWRIFNQLATLGQPLELPQTQAERYQKLSAERAKAQTLLSTTYRQQIEQIARYLGENSTTRHHCP